MKTITVSWNELTIPWVIANRKELSCLHSNCCAKLTFWIPTEHKLDDGLHLVRSWSWREFISSDLEVFCPPPENVSSVVEMQQLAKYLPISGNWLAADKQGMCIYIIPPPQNEQCSSNNEEASN